MCTGVGLVLDGDSGIHGGANGTTAAVHHWLFAAAPGGVRGTQPQNAVISPTQI